MTKDELKKLLKSPKYTHNADFERFEKEWEKFKDKASEEPEWPILDAWSELCFRSSGLPYSYAKYHQFLYALFYYDPTANKNRGGWRNKARTEALVKLWNKTTGNADKIKKV